MLSSFQERQRFGEREPALYAHLATRLAFVAVLGADLDPAPAATVRGGALPLDDLLRSEWNVVVLGPHFSAALVALDQRTRPRPPLRFSLTHDRAVVVPAARSLIARVAGHSEA